MRKHSNIPLQTCGSIKWSIKVLLQQRSLGTAKRSHLKMMNMFSLVGQSWYYKFLSLSTSPLFFVKDDGSTRIALVFDMTKTRAILVEMSSLTKKCAGADRGLGTCYISKWRLGAKVSILSNQLTKFRKKGNGILFNGEGQTGKPCLFTRPDSEKAPVVSRQPLSQKALQHAHLF